MSKVKDYLMEVSEEMGLGGEITEAVMEEGHRRVIAATFINTMVAPRNHLPNYIKSNGTGEADSSGSVSGTG